MGLSLQDLGETWGGGGRGPSSSQMLLALDGLDGGSGHLFHTGVRERFDIQRNLDLAQAETISRRGGIVGVTFNPEMLLGDGKADLGKSFFSPGLRWLNDAALGQSESDRIFAVLNRRPMAWRTSAE